MVREKQKRFVSLLVVKRRAANAIKPQVTPARRLSRKVGGVIRKAINTRKIFPHDQSALKVVYLAIDAAAKRWTMPIRNWKPAPNRFMIELADSMTETV